jgi:hypothetical protein
MAKFEMNTFLERWVARKAATNAWRMPIWMSPEDLIQEAHANWQLVNNHYDSVVEDVAHMVALFKTTYHNNITDFARNPHNPRRETSLDAIVEATGALPEIAAEDPEVAGLIAEAPEPVKSILDLLATDTERILVRPTRVYLDGTRDTLNRRIHRALLKRGADIDPRADALQLVHNYLNPPRRVRVYDEPTLIELVGVMVDTYLHPEPAPQLVHPRRPVLQLSPTLMKVAKDRVSSFLQPRPAKRRIRLRPIIIRKRIA